jgi:hypothetical protein
VPYLVNYGSSSPIATSGATSSGTTGPAAPVGATGSTAPTGTSTSGTTNSVGGAVTTSPALLLPVTPPSSFSASAVSTTQVKLFWSTSIYAIGYNVYEFVNNLPTIVLNVPAGTTSATIGNLAPGTNYAFNLVAYNTISSAGTAWVGAKTFNSQGAITPPQNFQSIQTLANQITLSWTSAVGESGYNLYQYVNGSAQIIGSYSPGVTTAIVRSLNPATTYPFNLVAWNQAGTVAATPWIAVTTAAASPPPVPQNFNGFATGTTTIGLTWLVSSGASGYQLYEFIGNQPQLISAFTSSQLSASVGNLSPGTTYAFNLVAFNASGFAATAWIGVTTASTSSAIKASTVVSASSTSVSSSLAATDSAFAQYATVDYLPGRARQ